jgi:hypothetical protein
MTEALEFRFEFALEGRDPLPFAHGFLGHQLRCRHTEADAERRRERPGTESVLLISTVDLRFDRLTKISSDV